MPDLMLDAGMNDLFVHLASLAKVNLAAAHVRAESVVGHGGEIHPDVGTGVGLDKLGTAHARQRRHRLPHQRQRLVASETFPAVVGTVSINKLKTKCPATRQTYSHSLDIFVFDSAAAKFRQNTSNRSETLLSVVCRLTLVSVK